MHKVNKVTHFTFILGDGLTVFAPTNAAFARLGSNVLRRLASNHALLKGMYLVPWTLVYNNNNNNFIVPIKGPRRSRELHIKQILIQCTYNNTTFYAGQNQRQSNDIQCTLYI
jgi:hypothetical protein